MYRTTLFFVCAMVLVSCKTQKDTTSETQTTEIVSTVKNVAVASPKVIVYRTTKDYSNNVPLMMDDSKTRIVSFPAPSDVKHKPVPTPLINGYLLDNRGIGKNVVFTSYTYEEYAAFEKTPSRDELTAHIIDKNPLSEMWQCDSRHTYKNIVEDLNQLITDGFPGCKALYRSTFFVK